ncbi:MAG: hypothetical protein R3E10_14005 [Gemmatimonadota bacterium]
MTGSRGWVGGALVGGLLLGLVLVPDPIDGQVAAADARALVERAAARMGGAAELRAVERVRLDMMTWWQRTEFRGTPAADRPSAEPHTDVRDYGLDAWRNTREFGARNIVNVVRDSIAITDFGTGFQPQSVAYVDERDELFLYTPDRLILALLAAADLRMGSDTTVAGERYDVVGATVLQGLPVAVGFHGGTGLPAFLRFQKGHPNDFGLVPWGDMEVEIWYAGWQTFGALSIPTQWDIRRSGRPYKRMTVERAVFNPEFAADSFEISTALRQAYLEARRPMHDRAIDSVSVATPGLVRIHAFGFPAGTLQVGGGSLLLEAGQAPLNLTRAREALSGHGVPSVQAALVAAARTGNGGVVALVREGTPVYTSAAARPFLERMLENAGERVRGITVVDEGRWLEIEGGRVRLEPIDLPDAHGSILLYAPQQRWVYAPDAVTPLDVRMVRERIAALAWEVEAVGTARSLWTPLVPGD